MNIDIVGIIDTAFEGNIESELVLGLLFDTGFFGENAEKAFEWYKRSADKDSPLAQYILSGMLKVGNGTPINHNEAFRYLQKSANLKFMPAIIQLALFYEEGIGVSKSIEKKINILKDVALMGSRKAALYLGYHFSDEDNGCLDYKEALKWFFLAESLGASIAYFHIASLYNDMKDFTNALLYYNKACDADDENACLLMAVYYSKGALDLEKDEQKAMQYSERAKALQTKRKSQNEILFSYSVYQNNWGQSKK
jgi:TPR repeat protein